MIQLVNKLDITIISGGDWVLCQMRDLQIRELHYGTYFFDDNARKECCEVMGGLRWWNKNKGECPPISKGIANPLSVNDLNVQKEKQEAPLLITEQVSLQ